MRFLLLRWVVDFSFWVPSGLVLGAILSVRSFGERKGSGSLL